MATFDLVKLARTQPINMNEQTLETVRIYAGVVGGVSNEKLALDYLEVTRYSDTTAPNKQPSWLKPLSDLIFFEAQRRGIVNEIEDLR
ncbi:MAG: hypothetical protein FWC16_00550 [Defluviitaleaceae bacterium]|nr:hypothetical protein [Defluviitaleaceae bacterium]MCL2273393.1 hypothetical protein [Defluviitaleaceae bacterium]